MQIRRIILFTFLSHLSFNAVFSQQSERLGVLMDNKTPIRYSLFDNLELCTEWSFIEPETEINETELDNITSRLSPLVFGSKVRI